MPGMWTVSQWNVLAALRSDCGSETTRYYSDTGITRYYSERRLTETVSPMVCNYVNEELQPQAMKTELHASEYSGRRFLAGYTPVE